MLLLLMLLLLLLLMLLLSLARHWHQARRGLRPQGQVPQRKARGLLWQWGTGGYQVHGEQLLLLLLLLWLLLLMLMLLLGWVRRRRWSGWGLLTPQGPVGVTVSIA